MKSYTLIVREDEVSKKIAQELKTKLEGVITYDDKNPQLVIAVGGDGTVLKSVHQYKNDDVYFLGIHTGTLGFFTDYNKDEIDKFVEDLKNSNFKIDERHLIKVDVTTKNDVITYYALNEMRFDHGYRTQVISVYINDVLLEVYRGNGLCVSSSSGSTAYNKSLGGAVIYPGAPLMQLTEVAGIHHNAYRSLGSSLVLDSKQIIKLVGEHFDEVYIGIDHLSYRVTDVIDIKVSTGQKSVKFYTAGNASFIYRVRKAFISE